MGAKSLSPVKRFLDWDVGAPWANNNAYQAATDGMVLASCGTAAELVMMTDGSASPAIVRIQHTRPSGQLSPGTMPVKKGDYWKVTGSDVIYWLPLVP